VEPEQPAPTVSWAPPEPSAPPPPRAGEPTGDLHARRSPSTFTLGDALSTGFGLVTKPTFIVPVLIIGIVVNFVISLAFRPFMTSSFDPETSLGAGQISQMMGPILVSILLGIIGGILINLYGQIWAIEATSGPLPQPGRVFGLAGSRWIGVIGTGIAVAVIMIVLFLGAFVVAALVTSAVRALGIPAFFAALVVVAWVGARFSMAGWLAAEGLSISNSINGSWRITKGNLLRIIGWSLATGIVFGIVGLVLGAVLSFIPVVGSAIGQSLSLAFGYGAGVTLYRRTQAAASPPAEAPTAAVSTAEA
jgi:hypothetical protein